MRSSATECGTTFRKTMFSIAAINDVDISQNQWQPLAPTKEAQEFRLTQMYDESLLCLQAKDYVKAQVLLQAIIDDPLSIKAEMDNMMSFSPMLQLRFLAFKNLAEAYFKQGPFFYKDALQCFLQSVSIDGKDVALWNRLGTLACLLGSFNIARMAFEQGLHCSPHHWGCMEKLVEVLIAIGDEAACLSVAKRLLKVSPSHPRAELVRRVIEENVEPDERKQGMKDSGSPKKYPVILRGIDKLKPQHYSLSLVEKRKVEDPDLSEESLKRRKTVNIMLKLEDASWIEVMNKILRTLDEINRKAPVVILDSNPTGSHDETTLNGPSDVVLANAAVTFVLGESKISELEMHKSKNERYGLGKNCDTLANAEELSFVCPVADSATALDNMEEKRSKLEALCGPGSSFYVGSDRSVSLKERDASTDEEPHSERRSTRLERIRTRKFDKSEEIENTQLELAKSKVSCEALRQLFEPYIVFRENLENVPPLMSNDNLEEEKSQNIEDREEREVFDFLREHVDNSGLYHIAQGLLERLSSTITKPLVSWAALLRLEKFIRNVSKGPSVFCSLFIAEVYMDTVVSGTDELEMAAHLEDCEYHLCRIIDCIAATIPLSSIAWDAVPGFLENLNSREAMGAAQVNINRRLSENEIKIHSWPFWLRFYWVSGRVRYFQGSYEKGRKDLEKCLAILEASEQVKSDSAIISIPHCKVDKEISAEGVRRKLYELQIQDLLTNTAAQMLEQGHCAELIDLLAPILLSEESGEKRTPLVISKKPAADFSTELKALNMLVCACENTRPKHLSLTLQCYERRMEIHFLTAGLSNLMGAGKLLYMPSQVTHEAQPTPGEVGTSGDWFKVIAQDVKHISRCVGEYGQMINKSVLSAPNGKLLGHMQQLLLTIMCHISMMSAVRKSSGLAVSDAIEQSEATCFVDAAVAFCRLQHLHTVTSIRQQVELLVTVHDVLAERGLCCAGKACEGGEGVFLKMAIKHLLALEMKLKGGLHRSACLTKELLSVEKSDDSIFPHELLPECRPSADDSPRKLLKGEEGREASIIVPACNDGPLRLNEAVIKESKAMSFEEASAEKKRKAAPSSSSDEQVCDVDKRKMDLGLNIALDQSFFCLYGLNLRGGLESTGQDGLAVHANTSLGDYQTKEQCAEVFQYLLPYTRVCTKASLVKLRKVLRAIRTQYPHPPTSVLENNAVDGFLDDLELDEDKLSSMVLSGNDIKEVLSYALRTPLGSTYPSEGGSNRVIRMSSSNVDGHATESEDFSAGGSLANKVPNHDHTISGPYNEVYGNLYYLLSQVEEMCASDKLPGFVFTKEGEDFVEQNVKLFKYDLLYNPLRFESWRKLANLFDEQVDLMLNDGSKTCSAIEWQKNEHLTKRVQIGRRRTRRCLLMSLALAKTPEQKSQVHELLALVYYDTLQNVAPSYNQRQHVAVRNSLWMMICHKSFMHFEKALLFKPEWMHLFYLGKLSEKMGQQCDKALAYYKKAAEMNPSAVDPLYRLHASRLKLLCSKGFSNPNVIQVVARYCYVPSTKEQVFTLLQDNQTSRSLTTNINEPLEFIEDEGNKLPMKSLFAPVENNVREAWNTLFEDCVKALEVCIEGELKHYHKARFRLAHGLLSRNGYNDIERAKEELAFCFKSNRSLFTINMWEIDGSTKRNRRKTPSSTGARRGFDISMPESSRKFITCLRKYLLFYLHLCEKTYDLCTLERAYSSLRVDKKFSLCLADMINVTLGKYIHTLGAAICHADTIGSMPHHSLKTLLEKFFNLFIEHGSSWSDVAAVSLTEAGLESSEIASEAAIHGYIHRYLHSLERENQVDALESVNEKIRKRFKIPKLVKEQCAQLCRHAAIAWCRALCASLSVITPREKSDTDFGSDACHLNSSDQLVVELRPDELLSNLSEYVFLSVDIEDLKQNSALSTMAGVRIRQASAENFDKASVLLRQTFTFYRDCMGPFPFGINLFLIPSGAVAINSSEALASNLCTGSVVGVDLSVPRKLLLWAYNLMHGQTCSIAEAVKFCEDQAKNKIKRGLHSQPSSSINCHEQTLRLGGKEASSSICLQFNNDEKDKPLLEEHETSVAGTSILPSLDGAHLCSSTIGLSNQLPEDITPGEENYETALFGYVDPEKE